MFLAFFGWFVDYRSLRFFMRQLRWPHFLFLKGDDKMYEKPCIRIILLSELDVIATSYKPEENWEDDNVDYGGWT